MGVQVLSYNFQVLGSSYVPTYLPTYLLTYLHTFEKKPAPYVLKLSFWHSNKQTDEMKWKQT